MGCVVHEKWQWRACSCVKRCSSQEKQDKSSSRAQFLHLIFEVGKIGRSTPKFGVVICFSLISPNFIIQLFLKFVSSPLSEVLWGGSFSSLEQQRLYVLDKDFIHINIRQCSLIQPWKPCSKWRCDYPRVTQNSRLQAVTECAINSHPGLCFVRNWFCLMAFI